MSMRRKTCRTGMAWLTAALTLVTAAPHALCRCLDGTVKPLDLVAVFRAGDCCAVPAAKPPARTPAPRCPHCRHHQAAPDKSGHSGPCAESGCCQKVTVPAAVFTVHHHQEVPAPQAMAAVPVVVKAEPARAPSVGHDSCGRPPPTDRVLTLQHFLI